MAIVVRLRPDEQPPNDTGLVLVAEDRSRGFVGMFDQVIHGAGTTFFVPWPYSEREKIATIERATSWADNHQARTVYVAA
jgi:hypothetical protein